jgi:hypothetical protein
MDTVDEVEELRVARQKANAVYLKFTESKEKFSNYAFCFFEGEDAKYYNFRIKKYFEGNFLTYPVGNKKEVLKLMNKIEKDSLYDNVVKMFFIDNDFDKSLKGTAQNLYETPCYSIENLYVQEECFRDIIQSEFGINQTHEDYQKCIKDFDERFKEFMSEVEEFNALALLRRKKSNSNSDVKFGDIKTTNLVNIGVNQTSKAYRYNEIIDNIKSKLNIQQVELLESIVELREEDNAIMRYRGKNQLDFLCIYLQQLKDLNNKGQYFSEKHNCVKLNITGNRLSELSQYALTPRCLDTFIHSHLEMLAL